MQARSAYPEIIYNNKNITQDISKFLINFSYTDNASGKADNLNIQLEDREGSWRGSWYPEKGAVIQASIIKDDHDKIKKLNCGKFQIDEINFSGPPGIVNIKCVSSLISSPLVQTLKNKSWEGVPLRIIALDIAKNNNFELFWDCKDEPAFERRDQINLSDLNFLNNICSDFGLGLKVHDGKIIIYDMAEYEAKKPIKEIIYSQNNIISWSFNSKTSGTFKKAKIKYHDAKKNKTIKAEVYADSNETYHD